MAFAICLVRRSWTVEGEEKKEHTDCNTEKKTGRIEEMKDWNQTYFTLKPPAEYLNNPVETVEKKSGFFLFFFFAFAFALFSVCVCVCVCVSGYC